MKMMKNKVLTIVLMFSILMVSAIFNTGGIKLYSEELYINQTEIPSQLSFIAGVGVKDNWELIETINFSLSKKNPSQSYGVKGSNDLIFSFKNVTGAIYFDIETENDVYSGGFIGDENQFYFRADSSQQQKFIWSLGFASSVGNYKESDRVDASQGILEIYRVIP